MHTYDWVKDEESSCKQKLLMYIEMSTKPIWVYSTQNEMWYYISKCNIDNNNNGLMLCHILNRVKFHHLVGLWHVDLIIQ